jgi:hypothetical protein
LIILKQNKLVKKRNVFLLDTFEGFKYKKASESNDIIWFDTHALYGEDKTKKKISKILLKCNYDFSLITNNIVDDQVPEIIKKVVVANIDVDMYEPTIECLKKISPIVVKGGIIIVEDSTSTPGLYGAYLAMNQFINSREGSKYTKLFKKGQYFLIKNE